MIDLDDEHLEAEVEGASYIAEQALETAYQNRDCGDLDSELDRAFSIFREAAETIRARVEAMKICRGG